MMSYEFEGYDLSINYKHMNEQTMFSSRFVELQIV